MRGAAQQANTNNNIRGLGWSSKAARNTHDYAFLSMPIALVENHDYMTTTDLTRQSESCQ